MTQAEELREAMNLTHQLAALFACLILDAKTPQALEPIREAIQIALDALTVQRDITAEQHARLQGHYDKSRFYVVKPFREDAR